MFIRFSGGYPMLDIGFRDVEAEQLCRKPDVAPSEVSNRDGIPVGRIRGTAKDKAGERNMISDTVKDGNQWQTRFCPSIFRTKAIACEITGRKMSQG
jgi:hypothetical protein